MKNGGRALARLALILVSALIVLCAVSSAVCEEAELKSKYDEARALYAAKEYKQAQEIFEALGEYSDSRARVGDCKRKIKEQTYKSAISLYKDGQYFAAKKIFESLGEYESCRSYIRKCDDGITRQEYERGKELYNTGDYDGAKAVFESLGKYRDSAERVQAADEMIKAREKAQEELVIYGQALALMEKGELKAARDAFIEAGDCKDATDKLYTVLTMIAVEDAYAKAESLLGDGDFESAYERYDTLCAYREDDEKAAEGRSASIYGWAASVRSESPSLAYILFLSTDGYKDGAEQAEALASMVIEQDVYAAADALALDGRSSLAAAGFKAVGEYADGARRAEESAALAEKERDLRLALFLRSIGEEERANEALAALGDFGGASGMIMPLTPRFTTKQLRDDRTTPMSSVFTAPDGTNHRYRLYKGVRTWVEAKAFCEALGGHLATLTTAEENAFVYGFMRECGFLTAYFGLSDEARTGDWIWVTGEPFEYTNWNRGEPSRSGRERYGMYFYKHTKGTWNDSHFYEDAEDDPGCSYICEWDE